MRGSKGKSTIKRGINIAFYVLVILFALGITVYSVIRDPGVQRAGIRMTAAYFSKAWKTEVRVGEFGFSLTNGVVLKDILVKDRRDSVLFATHLLAVQPDLRQLWNGNLHIRKVLIDGGEFQLVIPKGDSLLNIQFIIDYFTPATTVVKPVDTTAKPFSISGAMVMIRNFRFHYQDCNETPVTEGMDYANIDAGRINLSLSNFSVNGDTINANITHLEALERSGFELLSFSGEAKVCSRFVKVRNLKAETPRSELDMDFFMLYDRYSAFLDFINKVTIRSTIRPSVLNLADIGYFAPEMKVMDEVLKMQGNAEGTVNRFTVKNLKFATGEGTMFSGDVMAAGLPDIYQTYVDLNIREFVSNRKDLQAFKIPSDPDTIPIPAALENLGTFTLTGRFTGFWDDFNADFSAKTALGAVAANLVMKRPEAQKTFSYNGLLTTTSVDAGKLLGSPLLGQVTLRGAVDGSGFNLNGADITMNLAIDSAMVNGYNYQKIVVNGTLSEMKYDGSLSFRDPNIWLDFNGRADFHDSLPAFDFDAYIHRAQLFNLHLLDRDSIENISGEILARFTGNTIDNLDGMIRMNGITYQEGEDTATMDKLMLKTATDIRGTKSLRLESDYLNADITGIFSFRNMIKSTDLFIRNYLAHFNMKDSLEMIDDAPPQVMRFILEFGDVNEVTRMFLPFLKVSPGTILSGYFDTRQSLFRLEGSSPLLSLYGMDLSNWHLDAESTTREMRLNTGCRNFYLTRSESSDTLDIRFDTLELSGVIRHDTVLYDLGWNSKYGHSFLNGVLSFLNDGSVHIWQDQFSVLLKNNLWHISPNNLIVIDTSGTTLSDITFIGRNQQLSLQGRISEKPTDTLNLDFHHLDISDADYFLGNPDIDIDGILSGKLKLTNIPGDMTLVSDLKVERFRFNKELLGDALLTVLYDNIRDRFDINAKVIYTGNAGQNIPLSLSGYYKLGKTPGFDFDIRLKNLNLKMVEPFATDVMSKLSGLVSGEAHLEGTADKPRLTGQLKLMRTEFTVAYLNVPYSLSDVVNIEDGKIPFNNIAIYDSLGNKAYLNGDITHDHFKNFRLNLDITMNDFCAFNNNAAQNSLFYGKARASGKVNISGPIDQISIDVKASTGSNTHMVIPINLTADVGQMNYIIFEEHESDTVEVSPKPVAPVSDYGIFLNLNVAVRPDAEVEVFLPDQLGNLQATGAGNLTMAMTPTTPFTIHGSYEITKGAFLLQLRNLLRLPFTISEGSSISWSGDPADADINLSALYRTKVPLSGLTSDAEIAGTRVMTECILRMGGKLMNPVYEFGLNLPNAEESVKSVVFNAIDTTNQLEMSKQVLSVLMLNQFNPIVSGTTGLDVSGTSISIVTNQINSIISRMSTNVNVNVNYKRATANTGQEFDVGLSTQFLDDRLLIDGAFGMTSYRNASSQETSTIVGDINIEYLLTKNRRWRVRAFNRTNTLDLLYNNSPYTQGIGISYQRDFSSFRDLFSRKPQPDTEKIKSTP
ncbi:MAG TPA: translocation/assembly module TamB domain-containing protein [Bacteroidales bacterium]|nr:translocation/assembly module TamB domain-containing protein [Bacteroidales bacterium]